MVVKLTPLARNGHPNQTIGSVMLKKLIEDYKN